MFHLKIYDTSGNLLGPGPFFRVSDVTVSERLDETGEVTFSVPAGDARLADTLEAATAHYVAVVYDHPTGGARIVGRGLLGDGERSLRIVDTGPVYRYKLPAMLQELAWGTTLPRHRYDDVDANNILDDQVIAGDLKGLLHSDYGTTGWDSGTIDALGNVTIEFGGESILEGVRKLADEMGMHFRENATILRRLDFGAFGASSGIRLISPPVASRGLRDNTKLLVLESLEIVSENTEIINWVLPLGGGSDPDQQLTLEHSTRSSPYTISSMTGPDGGTLYYLDGSGAATERRFVLVQRDIVPASDNATDLENAANQLYDAAAAYLDTHKTVNTVYRAEVQDPSGIAESSLIVGNTVQLVYRGIITYHGQAYKFVDIDDDIMIVSRDRRWSVDGRLHYSLELSTGERAATANQQIIQQLARQLRAISHHPQSGWDGVLAGGRVTGTVSNADTLDSYDTTATEAAGTWVALLQIKTDTGDPAASGAPRFLLNTFDNTLKILENAAWQAVANW